MNAMNKRFAAFLRGVNVGGNRVIRMADLRACFEEMGAGDVHTVLQSGNVLFTSSSRSVNALRQKIESALTTTFDYPAKAHVYPVATLKQAILEYPFDLNQSAFQYYLVFVIGKDTADAILEDVGCLDQQTEAVKGSTPFIYWRVQKGMSAKSAFAKILAKAKYRDHATLRNMNTLKKMVNAD